MTAEPAGHVMWSPNPLRQRLAPFGSKLPIREITP